jgi:hypothetical protein
MLSFGELVELRGELILDQRLGPVADRGDLDCGADLAEPVQLARSAFTVRAGDSIASLPAR